MDETGGTGFERDAADGAELKRDPERLAARIREIVAGQLGVEAGEVVPQASILDDLGADSLDVVELVMALEEEFDIEVPDSDVEGMRTVGDVQGYVVARVAA